MLMIATAAIIAISINLISSIFKIQYWANTDFENWAAIVIEVGIAIFVSGMVLLYDRKQKRESKKQQDKMSALLEDTKKQQDQTTELIKKIEEMELKQQQFIKAQENFVKTRKNFVYSRILFDLANILDWIESVKKSIPKEGERYAHDDNMIETYRQYMNDPKDSAIVSIEATINLSNDVIEAELLDDILQFIDLAKRTNVTIHNGMIERNYLDRFIMPISNILKKIPLT